MFNLRVVRPSWSLGTVFLVLDVGRHSGKRWCQIILRKSPWQLWPRISVNTYDKEDL